MPSGGARVRSGPSPDPAALRRDRDKGEWTTLPAASPEEPAPDWPLSRFTKREKVIWAREWQRPQAVMWRRFDQVVEVAIYVRTFCEAERPKATVSLRTLLRQQMDALGLTGPGLRALRWVIATREEPRPDVDRRAASSSQAIRDRLKLFEGGATD